MPLNQIPKNFFLFPALIFCIAFALYANTIGHDFAWDDKLVITDNQYTTRGIAGVKDIFLNRVSVPDKNVYRPVPQALFAIEYDLFDKSPHASHFFSVLWYAALCLLIYFFVRFVFPASHPLFAFSVSLLFAVHPLHVEVVANIKSRDETLALLFGLLSIILLVKFFEHRTVTTVPGIFTKLSLLIVSAVCFGLAYLSKANAVTILPIALLILWYRNIFRFNFRAIITVVSAALIIGIVIWLTGSVPKDQQDGLLEMNATVLNNIFLWTTEGNTVRPTAIVNIGRYLLLFIFPHPLIHLYGYNQISLSRWSSPETWIVIGMLAGAAWYVFRNWKKRDPIVFGLIFAGITYSVYSNLIVLAPDTMADRYLFIPSVGLCIIAAALVFRLAAVSFSNTRFVKRRSSIAGVMFLVVVCAFAFKTFITNRDWKNDYTLIYNRIKYMQENAAAQATYGFMLQQESEQTTDPVKQNEKRAAAMHAFMRSVDIYPDFYWSWISMGKMFAEQQIFDKAELCFIKAQQLEPMSTDGYFCLGALYYTKGDAPLAITYLERTVSMDPSREMAYTMLGKSYLQVDSIANLGSLAEAALKWFPRNAEFTALMASYFYRVGKFREAAAYTQVALHQDPRNTTANALRSMPDIQKMLVYGDSTRTLRTPAP
ncbi:MAG TPA: hypothetical protein VGD17_18015 [Chitinophagaceae bacterium]